MSLRPGHGLKNYVVNAFRSRGGYNTETRQESIQFNTYRITYGIVSRDTTQFKDYARIDCFDGAKKVGQVLFGSSIVPGNNGAIVNVDEIHLYFPLSHFANIIRVLQLGATQPLALYLEMNENTNPAGVGGVTTEA
ncbi:MAG: hypothetical protein L0220_03010 [Acidobacteria bacterium]|nr:hypothetical protein [Acidobacteriota bacterium]